MCYSGLAYLSEMVPTDILKDSHMVAGRSGCVLFGVKECGVLTLHSQCGAHVRDSTLFSVHVGCQGMYFCLNLYFHRHIHFTFIGSISRFFFNFLEIEFRGIL